MKKLFMQSALIIGILCLTAISLSAQQQNYGTISGAVYAAESGEPIAMAMVKVTNTDNPYYPVIHTQTDSLGAYTANLPYGEYLVKAEKFGYDSEWWQEVDNRDAATPVVVDSVTSPTGIDFTLTAISNEYGSIAGIIYETDSTTVIANASVILHQVGNHHHQQTVYSAEDGTYLFNDVQAGDYVLACEKDGYVDSDYADTITVGSDPITGINFYLTPLVYGSIAGTVYESDSMTVIANAWIILHSTTNDHYQMAANSAEDGSYSFTNILAGNYVLACYKDGYVESDYADTITVGSDPITGINFYLAPLTYGSIAGTVYDASTNTPLANARISVRINGDGHHHSDAFTAEDGTYLVEGLLSGTYTVTACKDGYITQTYADSIVIDGNDVTGIDIYLAVYVVGGISGTVIDAATLEPIAYACVYVIGGEWPHHNGHTSTDENGQYSMELEAGAYQVGVWAFGYYSATTEDTIVVEDDMVTGVDFALTAIDYGSISGMVYNAADSSIIADARIDVRAITGWGHYRVCTDSIGAYSIANVAPGSYIVRAFAHNYYQQIYADTVVVENGADVTGIDFYMETDQPDYDGYISGYITDDSTGAVIANAMILGHCSVPGYRHNVYRAFTDTTGYYILENLPTQEFKLLCVADGYMPEFYNDKTNWHDADAVTPNAENINFALSAHEYGPRLTVGMVVEDGQPVDGAIVVAECDNEVIGITSTYSDGYYYLDNLAAGEYTITAYTQSESEGSIEIQLVYEDIYNADVVLSPTSIEDEQDALPENVTLSQNYPNPFNAGTNISFSLTNSGHVELTVFDLLGRKVKTLATGDMSAGSYSLIWNGTDNSGTPVASGMYLYILKTDDQTLTNRMTLLK